jgi:hypothetical protein
MTNLANLRIMPLQDQCRVRLKSLRKAGEIGADALIMCRPGGDQGLPGLPPSAQTQAVAIKYKLTHKPG